MSNVVDIAATSRPENGSGVGDVSEGDVVRTTSTLLAADADVAVWCDGIRYSLREQQVAGLGRCLVLWPVAIPELGGVLIAASLDDHGDRWNAYVDRNNRECRAVYRLLRASHGITYLGDRSALGCRGDGRPVWIRRIPVSSPTSSEGAAPHPPHPGPAPRATSSSSRDLTEPSGVLPVPLVRRVVSPSGGSVSRPGFGSVPGTSRLGAALALTRPAGGDVRAVTVRTIPWKVDACDRRGRPTQRWWCPPDVYGVVLMDSAVEAAQQPRGRYKVGYYDTQLFRERGDVVVSTFAGGFTSAKAALAFVDELRALNGRPS